MSAGAASGYARNVFVNCPFDTDYRILLRPLLFVVLHEGFDPQIASASSDSGEQRIDKIADLIESSRLGIHDLCRCQAIKADEFYRLNMPFELGLDVACRRYGGDKHRDKALLVLETKAFRYQAALSDIAGCDIAFHANRPTEIIRVVRDWLRQHGGAARLGPEGIWKRFNEFQAWNYDDLTSRQFSGKHIKALHIAEYLDQIGRWLGANGL